MAQFIEGAGIILTQEEKDNLKEASVLCGTNRSLMPKLKKAIADGFNGYKIKEPKKYVQERTNNQND